MDSDLFLCKYLITSFLTVGQSSYLKWKLAPCDELFYFNVAPFSSSSSRFALLLGLRFLSQKITRLRVCISHFIPEQKILLVQKFSVQIL